MSASKVWGYVTVGRSYAVAGTDRWGCPYAELGRGEPLRLSDGTRSILTSGADLVVRATIGGWAVRPRIRVVSHRFGWVVDVTLLWLWAEATVPRSWSTE